MTLESPEPRIVLIDDDAAVRRLLVQYLAPAGYRIEEHGLAESALESIRSNPPDLVMLDLRLPDRSGLEVLEALRGDPATRLLPIVMLTGVGSTDEKLRAQSAGVTDFVTKPFSPTELLPRVRALVTLKQFADEHEHVERVILMLASTIDARDPYTAGHSGRVAQFADQIGMRMGLDVTTRNEMRRGALFHDLGKIVIPDSILHKPGPLTSEERLAIQEHPVVGHDLLAPMRTMQRILPVVYHHHERLDGSGYPDGIYGDAIPMSTRIVTVADIFDALTSDRSYRPALAVDSALELIADGVGKGWWDREVLDALRGVTRERAAAG
jgi:putative two-component system response regulator